jgi:hypothetical protein
LSPLTPTPLEDKGEREGPGAGEHGRRRRRRRTEGEPEPQPRGERGGERTVPPLTTSKRVAFLPVRGAARAKYWFLGASLCWAGYYRP